MILKVEFSLGEKSREFLWRLITMLKDDLVAAGARLSTSVDNLTARIEANAFVGTVADADVQASIDLQNAQSARVDALVPTPAPAAAAAPKAS